MMDFAIVVDFLGIIRVFRMFRGLASKTRENGGYLFFILHFSFFIFKEGGEFFFGDVDVAGNLVGEDALKEGCPLGTIAGGLIFQYADELHKAIDGTDVVGEIERSEMGETYALYHIGEDNGKEDYTHVAHQLGEVGRLEFTVGTCRGELLLQSAVETIGCETVNKHGEESQDKEGNVWLDVSP